jgi:tRNA threonylcarbamoyl adenosine modification protein YeaZ
MKILALEFSSRERSVAVVQGSAQGRVESVYEAVETGGRAVHAFAMIDDVLRRARLEREQIECVSIGLGPGSYTGIRMAISLAQGWQLARHVKLLGISSVDCLAAQAVADAIVGPVEFVIDAQRGEFYLAPAELGEGRVIRSEPLRLIARGEVGKSPSTLLIGPEVTEDFKRGKLMFPRAATVGTLAVSRTDFVAGEKLEPIYLRETQFVKAPPPRILPE